MAQGAVFVIFNGGYNFSTGKSVFWPKTHRKKRLIVGKFL